MAKYQHGWCSVEGVTIPNLKKEYGDFVNIPGSAKIFFGTPAISIQHPTLSNVGCVYRVVPISEFGYETILEIDANYPTMVNGINSYDKVVDIENGSIYYYETFTISESSVIFYDASNAENYSHYDIILVDKYASPEIITVNAKYAGPSIPVGETYDLDDLVVNAVYSNGEYARIIEGYIVDPADRIITQTGSNVVNITYTSPQGTVFKTSIIIEGVKNLQSISAVYDGPNVPYGKEAQRKYFVVVAHYSDGSSGTVTQFSFPDGNVVSETNGGNITIFYKGFYTVVVVPTYTVTTSRLMAYYNGPNVEIGHDLMLHYVKVKIYYAASNAIDNYYEDVEPALCTITPLTIDHEGVNHITVQYTGKAGLVSTTMIVIGVKPDNQLNFVEAEYVGPEIYQGKSYSVERVICKAHYSDGQVVVIKNFSVNSNVVSNIGPNEFILTYTEKDTTVETTFMVMGLENDSTTESNYNPIYLQNNYPEASRLNNRYRGPVESFKQTNVNRMMYENIVTLYELFANIEQSFNELTEKMNGANCIKVKTLNNIVNIEDTVDKWMTDKRFTTGKYVLEQEE